MTKYYDRVKDLLQQYNLVKNDESAKNRFIFENIDDIMYYTETMKTEIDTLVVAIQEMINTCENLEKENKKLKESSEQNLPENYTIETIDLSNPPLPKSLKDLCNYIRVKLAYFTMPKVFKKFMRNISVVYYTKPQQKPLSPKKPTDEDLIH